MKGVERSEGVPFGASLPHRCSRNDQTPAFLMPNSTHLYFETVQWTGPVPIKSMLKVRFSFLHPVCNLGPFLMWRILWDGL